MSTIEIQIPDDLAQRLAPYRDELPAMLELTLRLWQAWPKTGPARLPQALHDRLHALLDKQDAGKMLTSEERQEAEALVELAEWLSLLYLRATRQPSLT
jgi:hypothetical protein